jgi:hypothetical protein
MLKVSNALPFVSFTTKLSNLTVFMIEWVSHPKNLWDVLTKAALTLPEGMHIQDFITRQNKDA